MASDACEVVAFEANGLNAEFWDVFVRDYWGRRPVVFKNVLRSPIVTPQRLFDIFVVAAERHLQSKERHAPGTKKARLSFYGDGFNTQVLEDHAAMLPTRADDGFDGYAQRLVRDFGTERWGAFLNTIHPYSVDLWLAAREMMHALFSRIGAPMGRVGIESFIGPYESTPFGVHKDQAHIFTFPVIGEKITRLWSYAPLATHLGLGHGERDLETVRNTPFRNAVPVDDSPARLAASAGDMTYWPPSYWHIVDGQGDLNGAITIGVEPNADPMKLVTSILAQQTPFTQRSAPLAGGELRTGPRRLAHVTDLAATYAEALRSPELFEKVRDELDRQDSALMFDGAIEPLEGVVVNRGNVVDLDPRFPIITRDKPSARSIACFVNGNRFLLARSPALANLIALLNRGGSHTVASLVERTLGWSERAKSSLDEDDVLQVLTTFVAFHALRLRGNS